LAAEANPRSATHTIRCRFQPARSSLTVRMIEVSAVLPGNVQHRTGTPSRVTAIAITTCGRSVRKSLGCPKLRLPCSTGRAHVVVAGPAVPVQGGWVAPEPAPEPGEGLVAAARRVLGRGRRRNAGDGRPTGDALKHDYAGRRGVAQTVVSFQAVLCCRHHQRRPS